MNNCVIIHVQVITSVIQAREQKANKTHLNTVNMAGYFTSLNVQGNSCNYPCNLSLFKLPAINIHFSPVWH